MCNSITYVPQVLRETAEGITRFDIRDEMLASRELELTCAVDAESCAAVIRGLIYLQRQDAKALITLYINSPAVRSRAALPSMTPCGP